MEVLAFQDFCLVTLLALHSLYGLQKYYLSNVENFLFTGVSRINFGTGRVSAADWLSVLSRVSSFIFWIVLWPDRGPIFTYIWKIIICFVSSNINKLHFKQIRSHTSNWITTIDFVPTVSTLLAKFQSHKDEQNHDNIFKIFDIDELLDIFMNYLVNRTVSHHHWNFNSSLLKINEFNQKNAA